MNELVTLSPYLLWVGIAVVAVAIARAFYLSHKSDYLDPHR